MSPVEHYFENLLTMGLDIKGEPNKNALSKEVQEAVEICATYIKFDNSLCRNIEDTTDDTVANEHIAQLKKLKSFNNGSYGASINYAIDSIHKCQRIAEAINKVEEYICDVETDTVKAQGMAQALDIFEQALKGGI